MFLYRSMHLPLCSIMCQCCCVISVFPINYLLLRFTGSTIWMICQDCRTIQYNTIQYDTTQYNTVQYNPIQSNPIQSNPLHYNTKQCRTIQIDDFKTERLTYKCTFGPKADLGHFGRIWDSRRQLRGMLLGGGVSFVDCAMCFTVQCNTI